MIYAQMVAGFIYLLGGGDLLVRGGVALARRLRVPPVLVAVTVVALGTSLPELMVSLRASMTGYPNLILGNVVGSNIANVLLVGGLAAAVYPLRIRDPALPRNGMIMLAVSFLFAALCLNGTITTVDGIILLAALVAVFGLTAGDTIKAYADEQDHSVPLEWVLGLPSRMPIIVLFMAIGVVTLPLGADLLVEAAVELAERYGVSETVIGLSVVALGTSLPEVSTTVLAALRRRPAMALGTIIGSNTLNLVAIMGVAAVTATQPVLVGPGFLRVDLPFMLVVSAVLVALTRFARRITRGLGMLMVLAYLLYLTGLYLSL